MSYRWINIIFRPIRHLTLRQAILITIPALTVICWIILLTLIYKQYSSASIKNYVNTEDQLVTSFVRANTTSLAMRNYPEVKRNMAALDFGTPGAISGIIDSEGEYLIADQSKTGAYFILAREWGKTHNLHAKYAGQRFPSGGNNYFVFQTPISSEAGYRGTFIAFVPDTMFKRQKSATRNRLLLAGTLLLIFQTIIIMIISNKIVAPIESFAGRWLGRRDITNLSSEMMKSDEPYTKDILLMSEALAKIMTRQAIDAALGRLSSQIAHDIRSPLASIRNYLNLNWSDLDEEESGMIRDSISRSIERITKMADELLDYSKASSVQRQNTDIAGLIKNAISEAKSTCENGRINLDYRGPAALHAPVDENKMSRVLTNLITNAIHAIPDTGSIIVSAALDRNEELTILVKDSGIGIAPEHISKIFDSSFTFGKKKGTGLGLAYCENVIKAHGGNIAVSSRRGEGSLFKITIPKDTRPDPAGKTTAQAAQNS